MIFSQHIQSITHEHEIEHVMVPFQKLDKNTLFDHLPQILLDRILFQSYSKGCSGRFPSQELCPGKYQIDFWIKNGVSDALVNVRFIFGFKNGFSGALVNAGFILGSKVVLDSFLN